MKCFYCSWLVLVGISVKTGHTRLDFGCGVTKLSQLMPKSLLFGIWLPILQTTRRNIATYDFQFDSKINGFPVLLMIGDSFS